MTTDAKRLVRGTKTQQIIEDIMNKYIKNTDNSL